MIMMNLFFCFLLNTPKFDGAKNIHKNFVVMQLLKTAARGNTGPLLLPKYDPVLDKILSVAK